MHEMADAAPGTPMVQPCADSATWIEVVLLDADDQPVAREPFELRLPDQSLRRGRLDEQGRVRVDGIVPGTASISFPELDAREWTPV